MEVLQVFDRLLEESRYVKQGEARGEAKGEVRGRLEALREIAIETVLQRFPEHLLEVRQRLSSIQEKQELKSFVMAIVFALDEESLHKVLETVPSSTNHR